MIVADIMDRAAITATPQTAVAQLARLLLKARIGAIPVVADHRVVGIVSEGDLMRRVEIGTAPHHPRWLELFATRDTLAAEYIRSHGQTAGDVMTTPVETVAENTPLAEATALMAERRVRCLPVLDELGRLSGVVSRLAVLNGLASLRPAPAVDGDDATLRDALRAALSAEPWMPRGVEILVEDGVAQLWGPVHSAEMRQALLVAARTAAGVREIEDHLAEHRSPDAMTWGGWPRPPIL